MMTDKWKPINCLHCGEKLIKGDNTNNETDGTCVECSEAGADSCCYDDSYYEEGV